MPDRQIPEPRVGRIVTSDERVARLANEAAFSLPGETLRSAFAISSQHVLTAWHCVRNADADWSSLWFRLRAGNPQERSYVYIPVRVTNYDESFDVAALTIDAQRLDEAHLTRANARALLNQASIPLDTAVYVNDPVQIMGFPESGSSADSDTNSANVVATRVPLGDVSGMKLFGPAFGAVSPVDPHGLSGGCVVKQSGARNELSYVAVGVVRAAPSGEVAGTAAGGCLIATHIADLVDQIPEVSAALRQSAYAAPQLASAVRAGHQNALSISQSCWRMLQESLVQVDDPEVGRLIGWPHFFNEPAAHRRPTAFGTAYGLKLSMVLGGYDYGLDRSQLAATLWKLRRNDGGWAARSGAGVSRPEVSALVLGALASGGFDEAMLDSASRALGEALTPGRDPVAFQRTYVVSAVLRGLLRYRPASGRLAEFRSALLSGAIQDPRHDNLLCWSRRLGTEESDTAPPSVAHTAQAVVALGRAGQVLGADSRTREVIEQSVRWLRAQRNLSNQTEQIRRYVGDNLPWDTLTVRHFTAAWVARALLLVAADTPTGPDDPLDEAMRQVQLAYRVGFWEWDDGERPLWMTYQAASVLRDYALRSSVILP